MGTIAGGTRKMIGLLVRGDNHFIVEGPSPSREMALALVKQWSIIQIGATPPVGPWSIVSKAFRENLEWAVTVSGEGEISDGVKTLLKELTSRGITVHDF